MNNTTTSIFDWKRLLPERGYRSSMSVKRGVSAAEYFDQAGDDQLRLERKLWLSVAPQDYAGIVSDAAALLREFSGFVSSWTAEPLEPFDERTELFERCVFLGKNLAPDWALMRVDGDGIYRLAAGSVCFPSSWALSDKLGKPIDAIHEPVPGLNEQLGSRIHAFLSNLPAEEPWERTNISFSGNTELNHHPTRTLTRLGAHSSLANTWVRLERQFFYKLPATGAIVFGIRVSHHGFEALAQEPECARRLARALGTMTDEMTAYKGMVIARPLLIEQLERETRKA